VAKPEPPFSPSNASVDPMKHDPEALTLKGALQTITRMEGLEVGLFRRTEGITHILWGFVVAGLFFSYFSLGARFPESGALWGPFLWIPWVAAGVASTAVVWRSAHLAARVPTSPKEGMKDALPYMAVFLLVMFLGFMVFGIWLNDTGWRLREPGYMMAFMSTALIIVGLSLGNRASVPARRLHVAVGTLGLICTALLAILSPEDPGRGYFLQSVVGALALGGGWLLSGLYLTVKG
jgi:hypothetical protein